MRLDLSGHLAVVTGASAGIGAATVKTLAAAGADVSFCARGADGVDELVEERRGGDGGTVRGYVADMASAEEVSAFLDDVEHDAGAPDILVNNVGQSPSRNFLHMTDEDWLGLFELNLMSAVRCTQRLLPAMRRRRWGRVVMISTGAAKYPSAPLVDYSATKAAMVAVGKAIATKYGADNILVNSVLPGLIDTPMWDRAAGEIAASSNGDPDTVKAAMARSVPLGRYGTAGEVAALVAFLCSDLAGYVTGTAISVDGGQGTALL